MTYEEKSAHAHPCACKRRTWPHAWCKSCNIIQKSFKVEAVRTAGFTMVHRHRTMPGPDGFTYRKARAHAS